VDLFFDSNILLFHLSGRDSATKLIENVENGRFRGCINDVVVSEVVYGFLRAETGLSPFELRKAITRIDVDLTLLRRLFELFRLLPCNYGINILEVMEEYHLLPNDALIAATCRSHGIKNIATFDEDFKRVDFLAIVKA